LKIAIQIRELVSSNVSNLVETATDAKKMLNLLRKQIEETIISLQGDLTRGRRRAERLDREAGELAASVDGWQDKAKIAMDHKREDLARSALLAKEDAKLQAAARAAEARAMADEVSEIEAAIAQLEAKHREVLDQLDNFGEPAKLASSGLLGGLFADRGSVAERKLEHVSRLEKRVSFATATASQTKDDPAPASVEAEIARLEREAAVAAAMASLKAAKPAKKAAPKRRKPAAK
jgi:phage shock protein A